MRKYDKFDYVKINSRAVAYVNSHHSREQAQDLHRLNPDKIPKWKGKIDMKLHL